MKKAWNIFSNTMVVILSVLAIGMMIFSVISTAIFDRNDRSIFGYRMMVVLSDSMSATDFKAGDLIFVKRNIDPAKLQPGDIISYESQDPANYGQMVTHKIRRTALTADGKYGFVTYGTTNNEDDAVVVTPNFILGKYVGRLSGIGSFFAYLKTTPGYLMFVFLPFALLIICQSVNSVRAFREYREAEMEELKAEQESLNAERERMQAEREENRMIREELKRLRERLGEEEYGKGEWPEDGKYM